MTSKLIIYKTEEGGVAIVRPTQEVLDKYGIDAIARKDVPSGKPYKIIDASDLPERETRHLWEVDEADLTDGVGAEYSTFPEVQP